MVTPALITRPKLETVLLIDDEVAVLESLGAALCREPYRVHGTTSAHRALEMVRTEPVAVVISDEVMPRMRGADLLAIVAEERPMTERILLTGSATLEVALHAINVGSASRFLLKPCPIEQIKGAIGEALERRRVRVRSAPQPSACLKLPKAELRSLSKREQEVLILLCSGHRVGYVAKQLFVSEHTVRNHVKALFRKLGVHSQGELIARAVRIATPSST